MSETPADVDAYLASLPARTAEVVEQVRRRILAGVPGAEETIAYAIPTFTKGGATFVHVAGWAKHVSVYPLPDLAGHDELASDVEVFRSGRSTLRLPLREPFPYELVEQVVALLVAQRT
jgi:uncharacterized protein YdhG (YjbR/CyaY superfamily)